MRALRRALALTAALLLLAGCQKAADLPPTPTVRISPSSAPSPSPVVETGPVALKDFLSAVNESRRAVAQGEPPDLTAYLVDHPEQSHVYTETEEEMAALTTYRGEGKDLTKEDLLDDVDSCLTLLRTTYGAYDYFGGDEVFVPLLEDVRGTLAALEDPTAADLERLLAEGLAPVVRDGHFRVGEGHLRDSFSQEMYYVPDLYFDDLTGRDMGYVKPTIGPDGRICYWYAVLSHDGSDLPDTLDGETLAWTKAGTIRSNGTVFQETEQDGVPVLVSRAMWASDFNAKGEKQLERLAACGGDYRDAPLLVFDVMGNGGGDDSYIMDWFEGWTGQYDPRRIFFARRLSQLGCYLLPSYASYGEAGSWSASMQAGTWTEREGVTFVLADKGTASSGESAVELFRTVENTLLVGGPTTGCALVPNNFAFYLSNSGLGLFFGTGLKATEDGENRDGVGFLPDLWVEPLYARRAVFQMIDYYGLKS